MYELLGDPDLINREVESFRSDQQGNGEGELQ